MKLYCDTCAPKVGHSNEANKCPWCDGYIRQHEIKEEKEEKLDWVKKGMIWVQKRY